MSVTLKKIDAWSRKSKVNKLIKAFSTVDDLDIRIAAIKSLGEIGDEKSLHTLISSLRDPEPQIRLYCVKALGKIGDGRAQEFVKNIASNDNNKEIRDAAIISFNQIKEKVAELEAKR